jgi:HEPN domain-containing protein
MIDVQKQIGYWSDSSIEDWQVAVELVHAGHSRQGLFFAQLALEKILKAYVCLQTNDLAPRIHNLVRLAEISNLELTTDQLDILAEMNAFSIEGRYPDALLPVLSLDEATIYIRRAEKIYLWLKNQLP